MEKVCSEDMVGDCLLAVEGAGVVVWPLLDVLDLQFREVTEWRVQSIDRERMECSLCLGTRLRRWWSSAIEVEQRMTSKSCDVTGQERLAISKVGTRMTPARR